MSRCFLQAILIFSLIHVPARTIAQDRATTSAEQVTTTLPADWLGSWRGEVRTQNADGNGNTFQMQLDIAQASPSEPWTWKITYRGAQGDSERDYQLVAVPSKSGQFIIDEKNGIEIAATLLGNTLQSHFSTGGQIIWNRYELVSSNPPVIKFELVTASESSSLTSGGKNEIPLVSSQSPATRQFGQLARANDQQPSPTKEVEVDLANWQKLKTDAYRGKQDDIYFVNESIGWYANGSGKIYKTTDGGATWNKQLDQPGTYFRCLAFIDENHGFAGNIGPDYFPNVSDRNPLYETVDGGKTWRAVTNIEGPPVIGLCALQVLKEEYINAGKLDYRIRVIGVGRVGGPTAMIVSDDLGATWQQLDISKHAAMAFDVHFFDRREGFIAAATDADVANSNATILRTSDGGQTWQQVYRSKRPYELTWKISFPTRETGYVTLQSYNPDPQVADRYVLKTSDAGQTWEELPLVKDAAVREFGIAFLNETTGWVGAVPHGFLTQDGGKSWNKASFGNAVNKIRLIPGGQKTTGYAIGTEVHKIELATEKGAGGNSPARQF